jgi:hypothetical protein
MLPPPPPPSQGSPPVVVSSVVAVSLDVSLAVSLASVLDELLSSLLDSVEGPVSDVVGFVSVLDESTPSVAELEFESADSVISSWASALSPIEVEPLATSSLPPPSSAHAPAKSRQDRLRVDRAMRFRVMTRHDSVEGPSLEGQSE